MALLDELVKHFSLQEAWQIMQPLILFVIGVAVYALFVFKFYRFLSRKDILQLNLSQYNTSEHRFIHKAVHLGFYVLEYVFLFPLFCTFWFSVLALLLLLLSEQTQLATVLLTSMAIVGAVRISAYYDEALSQDLAKMVPFALLGVFLVDLTLFSLSDIWDTLLQLPDVWKTIIYYGGFIAILEFTLRIIDSVFRAIRGEPIDTTTEQDNDDVKEEKTEKKAKAKKKSKARKK